MRSLRSKVKDLPEAVTSAVVVESAARFRDDPVVQLLDPQSAINQLLSHGISFYRLFHSFTCFVSLWLLWNAQNHHKQTQTKVWEGSVKSSVELVDE